MDEIIVVKQLPIIEERLKQISEQIGARVSSALALECTEETVKEVKKVRAELSKGFKELDARRKQVKNAILAPYEQFEAVYKACVTDVYQPADNQLRDKIKEAEEVLKGQKREDAAAYFAEYAASRGIEFLTFEDSGILVTLSASKKALKDQAKAFVDKVSDDLAMIGTQEYAAEILVEYRKSLNASRAVMEVSDRHKAIMEEQRRNEQVREAETARQESVRRVEAAIQAPIAPPKAEPAEQDEKLLETSFKVWGTLDQLKALKTFLTEGGYRFEQL